MPTLTIPPRATPAEAQLPPAPSAHDPEPGRADLVAGLVAARATTILDALTLPELWAELVGIHGWKPDGHEAWLRRVLSQQLLGGGPEEGPAREADD